MKAVLLDTGIIVALLDRSERLHRRAVEVIEQLEVPFITCEAAIAESCYLVRALPGAADAILENIATGVFQIPLQLSQIAAPVRRILRKYQDREIDLADACLIHLANEFNTPDILTLDRDFDIYRWGRNSVFHRLVPLD